MRPAGIVNNSSKDLHECRVYNIQFSVDYEQINRSFGTLLNYNKLGWPAWTKISSGAVQLQ